MPGFYYLMTPVNTFFVLQAFDSSDINTDDTIALMMFSAKTVFVFKTFHDIA